MYIHRDAPDGNRYRLCHIGRDGRDIRRTEQREGVSLQSLEIGSMFVVIPRRKVSLLTTHIYGIHARVGIAMGFQEPTIAGIGQRSESNDHLVAVEKQPRTVLNVIVRIQRTLLFVWPDIYRVVVGDRHAAERSKRLVSEHSLHLIVSEWKVVIRVVEHKRGHVAQC